MSVNGHARTATSGFMGSIEPNRQAQVPASHEFIPATRRRRPGHAWLCTCGRVRSKWMRSGAVARAAWRNHVYAAKERETRSQAEGIRRTREAWTTWSELQRRELRVGQRWRHYRGGVYRITALAIVEATMEPVVVYGLGDPARSWTRPLDEFLGDVDGVPRFVRAEETEGGRGPSVAELAELTAHRVELRRRLDVLGSKFLGLDSDDEPEAAASPPDDESTHPS